MNFYILRRKSNNEQYKNQRRNLRKGLMNLQKIYRINKNSLELKFLRWNNRFVINMKFMRLSKQLFLKLNRLV